MEAPLVSIVIVCMNRLDNLYPCLEGVRAHTGVPYECFVVAYRFSPENLAKAQADFPWVNWVVSDEVRGFSENNNLALRQARGKYCFILLIFRMKVDARDGSNAVTTCCVEGNFHTLLHTN